MTPPMMLAISCRPFNNLWICFASRIPIKQMANVITRIIETCSQMVTLLDIFACRAKPDAKASIAVVMPITNTSL